MEPYIAHSEKLTESPSKLRCQRFGNQKQSAYARDDAAQLGTMMASDADWLDDVRQWYFSGGQQRTRVVSPAPKVKIDPADPAYEFAGIPLRTNRADSAESGFANLN